MTQAYTARRLPVQQGPAAWSTILGDQGAVTPFPRAKTGSTTGSITADFVIIGGGFAGLSAAQRLLEHDPAARITLFEAGRLAEGAAGRNSGFMIDLPHDLASDDYAGAGDDRTVIALNRKAIGFARAAVAQYGIDAHYFDPAGKVNGAATPAGDAHNASYARHLETLGEPSEILDAKAMLALTGSRHYTSGLYTPGTVMLQPAGYIRGLGAGLASRISLYENTPVTGFTRVGGDWVVRSAAGEVTTPRVILANNGHLESFGIAKGRLLQLFLFASMTGELDDDALRRLGGQPRWGITPSDPMGTTMRRIDAGQGGNRIVTRTCAVVRRGMVASQRDVARAARVHRRKFDERFPQVAGVAMQYQWAGHLCLSLNGVSVLREVDQGVFTACVQNGLGTARGTLTGMGAADLACGVSSGITAYFSEQAGPKALPPQPFATIGANAYLRYKEWRAGAE